MGLTGYIIIQKRDINPQSPTYNEIRQDRYLSEECQPTAPDWVELTAYCEYGEDGQPTGQYVHVEVDQAKNSETYGQTREWKEAAPEGLCEEPSVEPQWNIDETFANYCETRTFQPSMVVGETGRYICRLVDDNIYSPTYGQTRETAYTENTWEYQEEFPCEAVDIRPKVEEISYSCVLTADTSGGMVQTGEIDIFGMDKNPYSSTYLSTTTIRETDIERCPPSVNMCDKYEFYDVGGEVSSSGSVVSMGYSSTAEADLSFSSEKSDSWITFSHIQRGRVYKAYMCTIAANNTGAERTGYAVFTSTDGCEFSGTVIQAGAVDCSVYGWSGLTLYEDVRDNVGGAVGTSLSSAGTLVLYDKPSWVTYITANTSQNIIAYIVKAEDSDGRRRSGDVVFRSSDGNCEFSGTVIQAAQASAIHITFSGLPNDLTSGGLSMTGSTYTAQFILAGPNAGTGTLYGTLSPSDSRQVMTFSGQFTLTSGGGNIVNACDGTSTSHIYTVSTASWDATTSTLNVTFGVCS